MTILIQNAPAPGDDASPTAGARFERQDRRHDVDRIAKEDGTMKSPFQDGQERQGVHSRRLACETGGDRETKEPMGDWAAEGVADLRRMIYVERIEIARETREPHDVGLSHRPARTFPLVAHDEIIKRLDGPGMSSHVGRAPPY